MAVKSNLVLTITMVFFQDFDNGKKIIQRVPLSWDLETDDMIGWKYGQRQGLVRVISCGIEGNELACTFQKIR